MTRIRPMCRCGYVETPHCVSTLSTSSPHNIHVRSISSTLAPHCIHIKLSLVNTVKFSSKGFRRLVRNTVELQWLEH